MDLNNRIPIMMTNQRKCPFSEIAVFVLLLCVMLLNGCGGSSYDPAALLKGERGLLPPNPEKGTVFDYYEPKGLAKWKRSWTYSLDLTGVSWNDSRTCTLIDPQHVVMAAHYIRPGDVAVMFHDRSGNQIRCTAYAITLENRSPFPLIRVFHRSIIAIWLPAIAAIPVS